MTLPRGAARGNKIHRLRADDVGSSIGPPHQYWGLSICLNTPTNLRGMRRCLPERRHSSPTACSRVRVSKLPPTSCCTTAGTRSRHAAVCRCDPDRVSMSLETVFLSFELRKRCSCSPAASAWCTSSRWRKVRAAFSQRYTWSVGRSLERRRTCQWHEPRRRTSRARRDEPPDHFARTRTRPRAGPALRGDVAHG